MDVGAHLNTIGGAASGAGNVISGNTGNGVEIGGETLPVTGNVVLGNFIGTDLHGTASLGNQDGIWIYNGSFANTIGGTATGAGNLISGNRDSGVDLSGNGTSGNVVLGNLIGTDVHGAAKLGNTKAGVLIYARSTANTVGGTASGSANVISGNANGVYLYQTGTSANVVLGNFIGADIHGTAPLGNTHNGVFIGLAQANTVGGTASGAANLISGNSQYGVQIAGAGASANVVLGNLIGTDITGTVKVPNHKGVLITFGATANTVGGTASGAVNVISGNGYGVFLYKSGTSGNVVLGNLIGTDSHGTTSLGNTDGGVGISGGATANTVGGAASGAANVISGNGINGVYLYGSGTSGNVVLGNLIGTDSLGTTSLGNGYSGITVYSATGNTIGGIASGAGNLVSGNVNSGIFLDGASGALVVGNLIGTDVLGTHALGNQGNLTGQPSHAAVYLTGGSVNNTIGGTASGAGNVISGNNASTILGAVLLDSGASGNLILGNFIGATSSGTAALANNGDGVLIHGSSTANTIGGAASGAANVISGNFDGVNLDGSGTSGNVVLGNLIGTDVHGTAKLGNTDNGIWIKIGAAANTVGGIVSGAGNVISGNAAYGVVIEGTGASANVVLGNLIGADIHGTANLGNGASGVGVDALNNTIGGTASGAGNVISGNGNYGLYVGRSSGNVVLGNLIGTDIHGTAKLANASDGVRVLLGAYLNTIGGAASGAANVISGNNGNGVYLFNSGTSSNVVLGNLIGTDIHGTAALGNGGDGVLASGGATANTVGGAAANVISGNFDGVNLDGSGTSGNVVLGNLIGADVHGTANLGNTSNGIAIIEGATANTLGGASSGAGNVIAGNAYGVAVFGTNTSGNVVLGNLIGTDVHGAAKIGNYVDGVYVAFGSSQNTIGGTASGAGNVISGNGYGVYLESSGTSGNVVLGNLIGTDVNGSANLGNTNDGLLIAFGTSLNTIGGTVAGSGNTIAFNAKGVVLSGASTVQDSILGNSIFSNTGLGIDLGSPAGNNGQAAPVLTSVTSTTSTVVLGTLTSAPGTYRVEFFASPSSGPAGQGKTYLGLSSFTVPSGGTMSFIGYGLAALPPNSIVTATATNTTTGSTFGDTSAFSAGLAPFSGLVVTDTSDSGSLRYQLNHLAGRAVMFDNSHHVQLIPGTGTFDSADDRPRQSVAGDQGEGEHQGPEPGRQRLQRPAVDCPRRRRRGRQRRWPGFRGRLERQRGAGTGHPAIRRRRHRYQGRRQRHLGRRQLYRHGGQRRHQAGQFDGHLDRERRLGEYDRRRCQRRWERHLRQRRGAGPGRRRHQRQPGDRQQDRHGQDRRPQSRQQRRRRVLERRSEQQHHRRHGERDGQHHRVQRRGRRLDRRHDGRRLDPRQ